MKNSSVSRFIAPVLVVLAIVISMVAAWTVLKVESVTQEFTLRQLLEEDMLNMLWVWISGAGALLVIISAFLANPSRTKLAQAGGYLAVILPIKVLWDGFTREDVPGLSITAGWGLWAALVLTVLAIVAAHLFKDDAATVVRTPRAVDETHTVARTPRTQE